MLALAPLLLMAVLAPAALCATGSRDAGCCCPQGQCPIERSTGMEAPGCCAPEQPAPISPLSPDPGVSASSIDSATAASPVGYAVIPMPRANARDARHLAIVPPPIPLYTLHAALLI
jgi:hypothetical protein